MTFELIIKPEAEKDIQNSTKYYFEQNQELSAEFIKNLDDVLALVLKNPKLFQKRYLDIRIVFTKKFPYGIYFTLEEDTIFIHAVLHNKQNPKTALKRIK